MSSGFLKKLDFFEFFFRNFTIQKLLFAKFGENDAGRKKWRGGKRGSYGTTSSRFFVFEFAVRLK